MTDLTDHPVNGWRKVDEEQLATPHKAHGYWIQPAARVTGWQAVAPTGEVPQPFMGAGAFLRIRPTVIKVVHANRPAYQISLTDPTDAVLQKLGWVAVAVALSAGMVNWLIRRWYG